MGLGEECSDSNKNKGFNAAATIDEAIFQQTWQEHEYCLLLRSATCTLQV